MNINDEGVLSFNSDDIFNLDLTLNSIIKTALIAFKESKRFGIPGEFLKLNYTEDEFKEAAIKWDTIVDDMIYAFSINDPLDFLDSQPDCPYNFGGKHFDEDGSLKLALRPGFTQDDVDAYEATREIEIAKIKERVKKGRELFIKYYDNLWI